MRMVVCGMWLLLAGVLALAEPPQTGKWHSTFRDDFSGTRLKAGWTDPANPNMTSSYGLGFSVQYQKVKLTKNRLRLAVTQRAEKDGPPLLVLAGGPLDTRRAFAQQYGYFEIRLRLPAEQGVVVTASLRQARQGIGDPEAITLFSYDGSAPETLSVGAHWRAGREKAGDYTTPVTCANLTKDFHTIGLAWSPTGLVWYVDGREGARAPQGPAEKMYLRLEMSVPGLHQHKPAPFTTPTVECLVDEVRVYAREGEVDTAAPLVLHYRPLRHRYIKQTASNTDQRPDGSYHTTTDFLIREPCYGMEITFDEPLDKATAEQLSAYGFTVFHLRSAELLKDQRTVRLRWDEEDVNVTGTFTVRDLRDLLGNAMPMTEVELTI